MPRVTISLDEKLLAASRRVAQRQGKSLSALVRELLERTVNDREGRWQEEFLALLDKAKGDSRGWKWNRDEIQRYG